jgi:hypothetical protein
MEGSKHVTTACAHCRRRKIKVNEILSLLKASVKVPENG